MSAPTLATPLNNASSALASAYAQGSGTLTVASGTGSRFGSPSPSAPIRITVASRASLTNGEITPSTLLTIFLCTSRSGDTLSGLSVTEGTTDRAYAANDVIVATYTAGTIADIHATLPYKADDAGVVHVAATEQITGAKSFTQAVAVPRVDHGTQGGTTVSPTPQTLSTHQPLGNITLGPWQTLIGGGTFSGQWDTVQYFGYNPNRDPAGGGLDSVHTWTYNLEATYKHLVTNNQTCEAYLEFLGPATSDPRLQRRPWGCNTDQTTTSTQFNIELGPSGLADWGIFSIVGGVDLGGDFTIFSATTGATAATSVVTVNCPIVQNIGEGYGMQLGSYFFNGSGHPGILFSSNHFQILSNSGTNVFLDAGAGGTVYVGSNTASPLAVSGLTTFSANVGFHEANPQHPIAATATNARAISVYTGTDVGQYGAFGFQFSATITAAGSEIRNYCPSGLNDADWAVWVSNSSGAYAECMRIHGATGVTNFTGGVVVGGSLSVGGGASLSKILPASAVLDFPSISASSQQELTISVTGATAGASVALGRPAALEAGLVATARVSASGTVTVRVSNITGSPIDPASATYNVVVLNP